MELFEAPACDGCRDKRYLRAAQRWLRETLASQLYTKFGLLCQKADLYFSPRKEADELIDFLLEFEALDLHGLAQLIANEGERMDDYARQLSRRYPRPKHSLP